MISMLKRFFDDINRLANFVTANPPQEVLMVLCNEDRQLLAEAATNYRRNKPRVKVAATPYSPADTNIPRTGVL